MANGRLVKLAFGLGLLLILATGTVNVTAEETTVDSGSTERTTSGGSAEITANTSADTSVQTTSQSIAETNAQIGELTSAEAISDASTMSGHETEMEGVDESKGGTTARIDSDETSMTSVVSNPTEPVDTITSGAQYHIVRTPLAAAVLTSALLWARH